MFRSRWFYALCGVGLLAIAVMTSLLRAQPRRSKPIHVRGYMVFQLGGQETNHCRGCEKRAASLALPNVFVHLEEIVSGTAFPPDVTDLSGRFHLTVCREGRYRLCWKADGFQPGCKDISLSSNTFAGYIAVAPQRSADTTTIIGKVEFRDGSTTRTAEPYMNINAFAKVEFTDAGGQKHLAYVNNFREYVLPLFPTKTPVKLVAAVEKGAIILQCSNKWTLEEIHANVLKRAGFRVEQSEKKTTSGKNKIVASIGASIFGVGSKVAGEKEQATTEEKTTKALELDPADVNDVIAALESINFTRYIVLEDFHYLPLETQKDFAVAIKAFHEASKLCFIVIGFGSKKIGSLCITAI